MAVGFRRSADPKSANSPMAPKLFEGLEFTVLPLSIYAAQKIGGLVSPPRHG
jgi:hypothetical protein